MVFFLPERRYAQPGTISGGLADFICLYTDLREALATEGKGYEGMIFREVVEQMEKDECCDLPYTKVVFVGLNALSVAEERFLSGLQNGE